MADSLVTRWSLILHPAGAVSEQAGGFDIGGHVGEFVLDGLEFRDGAPELFPLFRVTERRFVGALRDADGEGGDGDAAAVEDAQAVHEAFAGLAEELRSRETADPEKALRRWRWRACRACFPFCRRGIRACPFR